MICIFLLGGYLEPPKQLQVGGSSTTRVMEYSFYRNGLTSAAESCLHVCVSPPSTVVGF